MSVEAMAIVLHHSKSFGTAKVLLLGIANHDGDGGSWPSIETLSRYANVDERSVRRALERLVADGELVIHYRKGGLAEARNDRRTNRYEPLVQCPPTCDRTKQHRPLDEGALTSSRDEGTLTSERGDADVRHEGTPTPPEPSFNRPEPFARDPQITKPRVTADRAETARLLQEMNRAKAKQSYGPDGKPSGASTARQKLRRQDPA